MDLRLAVGSVVDLGLAECRGLLCCTGMIVARSIISSRGELDISVTVRSLPILMFITHSFDEVI